MSGEKLYAVKNDEGKYLDCEYEKFLPLSEAYSPTTMVSEDNAKAIVNDYGGHIVTLVEEPEKVVLTEEQAEIVERARSYYDPAGCISREPHEELLMNAYVNGYTVAKEKKYLVYKELGGKQKNKQVAQAYRSNIFPDTIIWLIKEHKIMSTPDSDQFTEAEIKHYGLQDCEKEEVTDDEQ